MTENTILTKADFVSDTPAKWCPGCWDFIILNQLQNTFAKAGIPKEDFVVISGIGCAGRLPYHIDTYGFHTIHWRAPTIATGVKLSNPKLQTWIITWDWDWLSIGANHLFHVMRKNIWVKILLFNNEIYALTKWQLSPTSEKWKITKTTPIGSIDKPVNPIKFALWLECGFVARTIDTEIALTQMILDKASWVLWTVFVEILQNCVTFNSWADNCIRNREIKEDYIIRLEHNKPLIFWKNKDKAIIIENFKAKVIEFNPENIPDNVAIYDETSNEMAYIIGNMPKEWFPLPIWIFKSIDSTSYEELYSEMLEKNNIKNKSLEEILEDWETWEIQ